MYFSVPLGHKLIAAVIAVATACGIYAFLRYREAQVAFAAWLSFDSAVAQRLDPGVARIPHPAVVLGQSILSDSVVARLVPQADLASFSTAHAIGEFRTRLELSQPTAGLLQIRYRDPDPARPPPPPMRSRKPSPGGQFRPPALLLRPQTPNPYPLPAPHRRTHQPPRHNMPPLPNRRWPPPWGSCRLSFPPRINESAQNRRCGPNTIARGTLKPRSAPSSRSSMMRAAGSLIQARRLAHKLASM